MRKKKHKEQCIKNKRLSQITFTLLLIYDANLLMSTNAEQFIKSCKSM